MNFYQIKFMKLLNIFFLVVFSAFVAAQDSKDAECDASCERAKALRTVAGNVAQMMYEQNPEEVAKYIDFDVIAEDVAERVTDNMFDRKSLEVGFKQAGSAAVANTLLQSIAGTSSKVWFLRVIDNDMQEKPVVRVDFESGGYEYLQFKMNEAGDKIVDIHFASSGSWYTSQLEDAARMLIKPSASVLKRMFGGIEPDKDLVEKFQKIGELRSQQKFAEAYAVLKQTSKAVQESRTGIVLGLFLSQYASEGEYVKQLELLADKFGDSPDFQFMLVDYYTMKEQYDKAFDSLTSVEQRLGQDGALLDLKANIRLLQGKNEEAAEISKQAIYVESDLETPYWSLATSLINLGRFDEISAVLDQLVDVFGYQFTRENFEQDPFYAEYSKTEAFDKWIKQHEQQTATSN